jgi:hypothetical protein
MILRGPHCTTWMDSDRETTKRKMTYHLIDAMEMEREDIERISSTLSSAQTQAQ